MDRCDIAIVGGGPAGLCLASALDALGLDVAIFETSPESALAEPTPDGREIALTHASRAFLESLGVWARLPEQDISPLKDAAVFDGESEQPMRITHQDGGRECLGWLIANQHIKKAAYDAVVEDTSTRLMCEVSVTSSTLHATERRLMLSNGEQVAADLVIAADSRFSNLRRMTGIGSRVRDYGRSMLLAKMQIEGDHEQVAWEWFAYDRTLALLPLNGQRASAVITLPHEQTDRLAQVDEATFNEEVTALFRHRVGEMTLQGERHVVPLMGVWPDRLIDERLAVLGDAAVGMHPVTAHGFNLGLRGVQILSEELARAGAHDLANPIRLRAYQRRHRLTSLPLYLATSAVVGLYSDTSLPAKFARRSLLRIADKLWPFRRAVARQLTG